MKLIQIHEIIKRHPDNGARVVARFPNYDLASKIVKKYQSGCHCQIVWAVTDDGKSGYIIQNLPMSQNKPERVSFIQTEEEYLVNCLEASFNKNELAAIADLDLMGQFRTPEPEPEEEDEPGSTKAT